jgi:hypothetical protein
MTLGSCVLSDELTVVIILDFTRPSDKKMSRQVRDKNSQAIKEEDHVWTNFRGGKREGQVERVDVTDKMLAKQQ